MVFTIPFASPHHGSKTYLSDCSLPFPDQNVKNLFVNLKNYLTKKKLNLNSTKQIISKCWKCTYNTKPHRIENQFFKYPQQHTSKYNFQLISLM